MQENTDEYLIYVYFIYKRIYNDTSYLINNIQKLLNKIDSKKNNFIDLTSFSKSEIEKKQLEYEEKRNLLSNLEKLLIEKGLYPNDVITFKQFFDNVFRGYEKNVKKTLFLMQLINYPLYAVNETTKYKEHTRDFSFEEISLTFGFEKNYISELEKDYKYAWSIIKPNNSSLSFFLGMSLITLILFPSAILAFTENVGIFGLSGPRIMRGLSSIGKSLSTLTGLAPSIMGISTIGMATLGFNLLANVTITEIKNRQFISIAKANHDQLVFETLNFIVANRIFKRIEKNDFFVEDYRKEMLNLFLKEKNDFERTLLSNKVNGENDLKKSNLLSNVVNELIKNTIK